MTTSNQELQNWVEQVAALTKPDEIHWCTGSENEYKDIIAKMLKTGDMTQLNEESYPNCYLHRSDPSDVARVEHLTFVCTKNEQEAGPNNHWMNPKDAHAKIDALFENCMQGRTLYVIPYCMGPIDSPLSRCGVEITDSPYVVANMHIMTRSGDAALKRIEKEGSFVRGLHSTGDLDPERRFIMHFPEELTIKSIGSGYGGNALLGKKCHALRIASYQARTEGWLAEHMLIVGIEDPQGKTSYIAAAFPSACGKTNLAMLIPPEKYKGYKIWTVGDDIAWLHLREDGRLWAINPEAGYFGVAPGTGADTNPNALNMLTHDCIFTNVATSEAGEPWWEGKTDKAPDNLTDWRGNPWKGDTPAAQPNSRFTVSAKQCASYSPKAEDPNGVPISAIVFGGRRRELAPLVYQAKNWAHGVLTGASVASETTAAATGQVGVVRRDPMAMKPFCGYNYGNYWAHWLSFGKKSDKLPKVFHVNWFRRDKQGNFMWPGFGDNLRVLNWILDRCANKVDAQETPIGFLPDPKDIDTQGLDVTESTMQELTSIDKDQWKKEFEDIGEFLETFGPTIPAELQAERAKITAELG